MLWTFLYYLLEALKWLVVIRALLSWFVAPHSRNPVATFVRRVTDPVLRPISERMLASSGFDFSPIVAFFAIVLLQQVIIRLS